MSLTFCAFLLLAARAASSTTVLTTSGHLLGRTENGVRQFLGVPYASRPIRFRPAEPLTASPNERDATVHGPACIQPPHLKEVISPLLDTQHDSMSEDCLNLNIYVPEDRSSTPMSLAVWLPGEGFDYANANQFNGSHLARQGHMIVVTVNYRVSVFGFLSAQSDDAPGNLGFLDQRLALQWVRKNAVALGGDPDRITVLGRFTGAMSISAQLTSPTNRRVPRLFARAVLQSGIATGPWVMDDQPLDTLKEMATAAGCPLDQPLPCLRQMSAQELLQRSQTVNRRFRPVIDGQFLVEDPMEAFKLGRVMDADVILGSNSDEGSLCLLTLYYNNSTFYRKLVRDELSQSDFGDLVSSALEDYTKRPAEALVRHLVVHEYSNRKGSDFSFRDSYVNFCGAMYITTQMEQAARYLSASPAHRVFVYEFDHRPSFSIQPKFLRGAAHGDDVLFALGLLQPLLDSIPEEKRLSQILVDSISSFANTGIPTFKLSGSSIQWPQYTLDSRQILHLTLNPSIRATTHDRDVSFWQSVVPSITSGQSNCLSPAAQNAVTNSTVSYIVGSLMTVQTTEYVLISLTCLILILLSTVVAAPHFMHRHAVRKDSMLAELVY